MIAFRGMGLSGVSGVLGAGAVVDVMEWRDVCWWLCRNLRCVGAGKGFLSLKTNLILVMHMRMKAIYKDAVLKPLTELDLKEGDVVVIDLKKASMRDFYGKVEIEKPIADEIIEMELWD